MEQVRDVKSQACVEIPKELRLLCEINKRTRERREEFYKSNRPDSKQTAPVGDERRANRAVQNSDNR